MKLIKYAVIGAALWYAWKRFKEGTLPLPDVQVTW